MSDYSPITLQIIDDKGKMLVNQTVPFSPKIDVIEVMESAFVLMQTAANPDPFLYTVEYYGYSEAAKFPGYLGYEIESILNLPSNDKFYWALSINGIASMTGADTTYPAPGSTVLWTYTPNPVPPVTQAPRTQVVQSRRATRAALTASKTDS